MNDSTQINPKLNDMEYMNDSIWIANDEWMYTSI